MAFRNDFTVLKSREHLLYALGVDEVLFAQVLAFEPPQDPPPERLPSAEPVAISIPAFFRHKIPKKNRARGYRVAWEPTHLKTEYKALARWLGDFLGHQMASFPHPAVYGYVGGRNIKDNAAQHCGAQHLLSVDLKDFFQSITRPRVEALFVATGLNPKVANLLSSFVTIAGSLPLGLPTSPVLSNAVFLPADLELQALADVWGATYTRYSDDLGFSSDGDLPPIEEITAIMVRHDFAVATAKTRRSRRGQAHFVTGLSISDPERPHVPKAKKRTLRQELYYARKYGLTDHLVRRGVNDADVLQEEINRLDGMVKFVAYHEPRLSPRIKPLWTDILREADVRPSYSPRRESRAPFTICIDEAEFASSAGPVLALGLSVSQHQGRLNGATIEVIDETLGDMWSAGNREALLKKGLHFADAHPDLVLAYVKRLKLMPFEGYVTVARLTQPNAYEDTYLRLLGTVIRRRLMAAESQFARFVIEKNSKVSEEKVRALITQAQADLRLEKNRHPKSIFVDFVSKPNVEISVPDFLLGVLGRYLASPDPRPGRPEPRERILFERIRDKYRLILDVDAWVEYSRRRPISPWAAL